MYLEYLLLDCYNVDERLLQVVPINKGDYDIQGNSSVIM